MHLCASPCVFLCWPVNVLLATWYYPWREREYPAGSSERRWKWRSHFDIPSLLSLFFPHLSGVISVRCSQVWQPLWGAGTAADDAKTKWPHIVFLCFFLGARLVWQVLPLSLIRPKTQHVNTEHVAHTCTHTVAIVGRPAGSLPWEQEQWLPGDINNFLHTSGLLLAFKEHNVCIRAKGFSPPPPV